MGGPAPAVPPADAPPALSPMEAEAVRVCGPKETWPEVYDIVVRIAILGAAGVGKSTLTHKFIECRHDKTSTVGVDTQIRPVRLRDLWVRCEIYDTAGQERFASLVQSYVRNVEIAIFCYDVGARSSFDRVEDVRLGCERYWRAEHHPVVALVGCKSDGLGSRGRAVTAEEAADYARAHRLWFFECSGLTGRQVKVAFGTLLREAVDRIQRPTVPPPDPAAEARRQRLKAASSRLERLDKERRLSLELAAPAPPPPAPPSEPSDEGTNSEAEEEEGRRKAGRARQAPVRLNGSRRGVPLETAPAREKTWWTCWM